MKSWRWLLAPLRGVIVLLILFLASGLVILFGLANRTTFFLFSLLAIFLAASLLRNMFRKSDREKKT